ncbi:DNA-processing protein DprA [Breznakiellaceae bacterium SP9]
MVKAPDALYKELMIERLPGLKPREKIVLSVRIATCAELLHCCPHDVELLINRSLSLQSNAVEAASVQAEKDLLLLQQRGIAFVAFTEAAYPPLLKKIYDPPFLLFYRGRLPDPETPLVAVVGTRKPSGPASRQAYAIAKGLGQAGLAVVSGLALGIDALSHRGNLEGGGRTSAVLGSGLDMIYPASNRLLARHIVESGGCLLSEYPPGTPPFKGNFPARNRIIAGITRGTLIVEAPEKSGALITARFALESGRDLWVAVTAQGTAYGAGAEKLCFEGARGITSADEILAEWNWKQPFVQDPLSAVKADSEAACVPYGEKLARSLLHELQQTGTGKPPK